jgi:hypothetical protein
MEPRLAPVEPVETKAGQPHEFPMSPDNATGLRLRFHEDAAELATLPWEILYDGGQERFLALSESLPIVRYLSLPRPRPALVTEPPLRILVVPASPDGLDALNLEGEWQVLAEALAGLVDDGKVVLERLASPTPSALQGRLLGDPVHVLHFVGHGVFDEESKQGMLVLADERNQPKLMGARELATLLANHTSLRLLYLNACEGALGDDASVRLWHRSALGTNPIVLRVHEGPIRTLAFSPVGGWLATAGHDTRVRLWDLSNLGADPIVLDGLLGSVDTLASAQTAAGWSLALMTPACACGVGRWWINLTSSAALPAAT